MPPPARGRRLRSGRAGAPRGRPGIRLRPARCADRGRCRRRSRDRPEPGRRCRDPPRAAPAMRPATASMSAGLVGRQVRAGRGAAVVGLGPGRGRPAPEVARIAERLSEQFRTDDTPVAHRSCCLRPGGETRRVRRASRAPDRATPVTTVSSAKTTSAWRISRIMMNPSGPPGPAASSMSISLMPTNGTTRPPRP